METWEEKYVDTQVDRAWLDLRVELADRFAAGLAGQDMDPVDFTAPGGETLTVIVDDGHVVVFAGDETFTSDNVDEAAHTVYQVLHEEWQVVHPTFLESEVIEVPAVEETAPKTPAVPELGVAGSQERLQAWVEATFQEDLDVPLKIGVGGRIHWSTRGGGRVTVRVRNAVRVELTAVVARNVGRGKAQKVIADLAPRLFGLKLFLVQDTLMMSQIIIANPYAPAQLRNALRTFSNDLDKLAGWVPEKVLRNRVRRDRDEVAKAAAAQAVAEESAAAAAAERDAARTEMALLKRRLRRLLMDRPPVAPTPPVTDTTVEDLD